MDSKFVGNITELEVLTYITKLGYQVSIPFGDRERYDQIWDINGKLLRIQVKTSHLVENAIKFSCRSAHRVNGRCVNTQYTSDEIDYFATYWDKKCYLIPVGEVSNEKTLRFIPPKSGQIKGISFAKDYEVEEMLKKSVRTYLKQSAAKASQVRILLVPPWYHYHIVTRFKSTVSR